MEIRENFGFKFPGKFLRISPFLIFMAFTTFSYSQELCEINFKLNSTFEDEKVYLVETEFFAGSRKGALLYCDLETLYPTAMKCNNNKCFGFCYYPSGKFTIGVADVQNKNSCNIMCSKEIVIKEKIKWQEIPKSFEAFDTCGNGLTYVANGANDTVLIMKAEKPVKEIWIGDDPRAVRCNEKTKEVWIANFGSGCISILDYRTNEIKNSCIETCINPSSIEFSEDYSKAFVSCWGGKPRDWCEQILNFEREGGIDLLDNVVLEKRVKIELPFRHEEFQPCLLCAIPFQGMKEEYFIKKMRVLNPKAEGSGGILVIDSRSKSIKNYINVVSSIEGSVWKLKNCGNYLFGLNDGKDLLHVIDPKKEVVIKNIEVGEMPWDFLCDEESQKIYVANGGANSIENVNSKFGRKGESSLSVIDLKKLEEVARIPFGYGSLTEPFSLALSKKGTVYVTDIFHEMGTIRVADLDFSRDLEIVNLSAYTIKPEKGIPITPLNFDIEIPKDFEIRKGLNLLAFPSKVSKEEIERACGEVKIIAYDPENGEYKVSTEILPFRGYWISSKKDCKLELFEPEKFGALNLEKGWNLIFGYEKWSNIKGDCELNSKIYSYDNKREYKILRPDSELTFGRAYWVHVKDSCSLNYSLPIKPKNSLLYAPYLIKNGLKEFHLKAEKIYWNLLENVRIPVYAFNRKIPGPIIRANKGEKINVVIENKINEPIEFYIQGLEVKDSKLRNRAIMPGEKSTLEIYLEKPGIYPYYSRYRNQKDRGLSGIIIIDDLNNSDWCGTVEEFLLILDEFGEKEKYYVVNGKSYPETEDIKVYQGDKALFRIVNLGNEDVPLHFEGHRVIIYSKNNEKNGCEGKTTDIINLAPGERYQAKILELRNTGSWMIKSMKDFQLKNSGEYPGGIIVRLLYNQIDSRPFLFSRH